MWTSLSSNTSVATKKSVPLTRLIKLERTNTITSPLRRILISILCLGAFVLLEYKAVQERLPLKRGEPSIVKLQTPERVQIFYHLFTKSIKDRERVTKIVEEQFALVDPTLHDPTVRISSIGHELQLSDAALGNASFTIDQHQKEGDEILTLHELWTYCQYHTSSKVVYLHSKGSFHPSDRNDKLRKFLTSGALSAECANLPDTCNVCSSRMSPLPHPHTPGNMWLAKCDYVTQLVSPLAAKEGSLPAHFLNSDSGCDGWGRYFSEHWVHSHPLAKPCDLYPEKVFVWMYNGIPSTPFKKELQMAPRFDYQDYVLRGICKEQTHNEHGTFSAKIFLAKRHEDYKTMYNISALPEDWWGKKALL